MFSRRAVLSLQPLINVKIRKLCDKLSGYADRDEAADIASGFHCAAIDIVSQYCYNECLDSLDVEGFKHGVLVYAKATSETFWTIKYFPLVEWLLALPRSASLRLVPELKGFLEYRDVLPPPKPPGSTNEVNRNACVCVLVHAKTIEEQVNRYMKNPSLLEKSSHTSVYQRFLDPQVKGGTPSFSSLVDEAQNLFFAGSDTVSGALTFGTYHILATPGLQDKVFAEICRIWPVLGEEPTYEQLEKSTYLVNPLSLPYLKIK